jgi:DNA-binding NarL/FixJ family response regulator
VSLPVRVAAVNDYDLVVDGVAALLCRYPDRLLVCERILVGEPIEVPIDVALYDTFGRVGDTEEPLRRLVEDDLVVRVAVFSFDFRPELITWARAAGASGFISKALPGEVIADSLVRIAAGEYVELTSAEVTPDAALNWPGRSEGLSERESQVLVLSAEGLTNREIGAQLYIGVETVKSHLRAVYAKLGLRNRVQGVHYIQQAEAYRRVLPAHAGGLVHPIE